MKKRLGIVGSSGLLGSYAGPWLRGHGQEVFAAHRFDFVRAPEEFRNWIRSHGLQAVLNFSAISNVDLCEKEPWIAYDLHSEAVQKMAQECQDRNCTFVTISTDQVYDGPGFNSENQVRIVNHYAGSKLAGEKAALLHKAVVLRTNFFGPSRTPSRTSFSDWLLRSFETKAHLKLATDCIFSPLHMESLSAALLRVLERPVAGLFNLGAHGLMSKRDFAFRLAELRKFDLRAYSTDVKMSELDLAAPRPRGMAMNVTLFEKTFGLTLPSLEEEIARLRS